MLISREALHLELPALQLLETPILCHELAMLGLPVDAVEPRDGDTILDVDVTANRGDALSHWGICRDLAARLGEPLGGRPAGCFLPTGEGPLAIRLESEACTRYATALIDLGRMGAPPIEAARFLERLGSSPKGLAPVDASNELLHRYGHPTHAFDADTLVGDVAVRWARVGEYLTTLDGVTRTLETTDLVIADERGPIALAGLMGGDATKVTEATRRVLLESAYFDPRVVRAMSRRHGLFTDASLRFGRGADPGMADIARDLLAQRLVSWSEGNIAALWTVGKGPGEPAPILFRQALLTRIAGEPIAWEEAGRALAALGCQCHPEGERVLRVVPPAWRHDLGIPEDLAEEVLRMRGFERIPSALPPMDGPPEPLAATYQQRRALAGRLAHLGFHQTVTYGFVSPEMDQAFAESDNPPEGRTLLNPLGHDYSVLRSSLLPSLRHAAEHNLRQGAREVRLFEIAPVFRSTSEGPQEVLHVALVWAGTLGGRDYLSPARTVQAADLVGVLADLGLAPGCQIQDVAPGILGAEVDLQKLQGPLERIIPSYRPLSRFPLVERDVSLLVGLGQAYRPLEAAMREALPADLLVPPGVRCVDVFRHKSLPEGKQAWLMRMQFQAMDRTLTSAEVDGWVAQALAAARSLGAELRG